MRVVQVVLNTITAFIFLFIYPFPRQSVGVGHIAVTPGGRAALLPFLRIPSRRSALPPFFSGFEEQNKIFVVPHILPLHVDAFMIFFFFFWVNSYHDRGPKGLSVHLGKESPHTLFAWHPAALSDKRIWIVRSEVDRGVRRSSGVDGADASAAHEGGIFRYRRKASCAACIVVAAPCSDGRGRGGGRPIFFFVRP